MVIVLLQADLLVGDHDADSKRTDDIPILTGEAGADSFTTSEQVHYYHLDR